MWRWTVGVSCEIDLDLRSCWSWAGIQHTTFRSSDRAGSALEQAGVQELFIGTAACFLKHRHPVVNPMCSLGKPHLEHSFAAARAGMDTILGAIFGRLRHQNFCIKMFGAVGDPTCVVLWTRTLPKAWDVVRGSRPLRAETGPPASARTEFVAPLAPLNKRRP
jgi:hypothetical protein